MASICIAGTMYDFYIVMLTPDEKEEHIGNGRTVNEVDTSDTAVLMHSSVTKGKPEPGKDLFIHVLYVFRFLRAGKQVHVKIGGRP